MPGVTQDITATWKLSERPVANIIFRALSRPGPIASELIMSGDCVLPEPSLRPLFSCLLITNTKPNKQPKPLSLKMKNTEADREN